MSEDWEWPVLLLILALHPDTWIGEWQAVQDFSDLHIAWRTGRLDQLIDYRPEFGWINAYLHGFLDNGKDPS